MSADGSCRGPTLCNLATEAYRRPLAEADISALMNFYEEGVQEGGFEGGVRMALQAILASPHFIFRMEEVPDGVAPGEIYNISDTDLASRLSYFMWGAPPDEEQIEVAERGRLSRSKELEQQERRMLADPRAEALATRFASQWWRLQDL